MPTRLLRVTTLCAAALWSGIAVSAGSARDHTPGTTDAPRPHGVLTALALASTPSPAERVPLPSAVSSSTSRRQPVGLDPALLAARTIARRVRGFRSFRAEIPLASWRNEPRASWRVRTASRCLNEANKLRLPVQPLTRALITPVPAPVVLHGSVGGVSFRPVQSDRDIELSCELATRLPALAVILKRHGVRVAHVNSSYREQPRVSFHTFGLALDIASFETKDGPLVVATDFELTPDLATCDAKPSTERARALLSLACDLASSGLFSSVLTPNYNAGHRDHFHLDVRPDDPRLFVR